jgi:hypothetical protein
MGTRYVVVGALCAALALGGCAQNTSGTGAEPGASMSTSPSADRSTPSRVFPGTTPTGELTLTGQVEKGVEAGCLLLKQDGMTYLLVGGDPAVVKEGAQVRVTGRIASNVMSYCMQGTPFQVAEAHPA